MTSSRPRIPLRELRITAAKSSGGGGQNVNKVATKAVLRWSVRRSSAFTEEEKTRIEHHLASRLTQDGDLVLVSQRTRSQAENRNDVIRKLEALVAAALRRTKTRRPTRRTRRANEQRLQQKKRRSSLKYDRRSSFESQ